MGAHQEESGGYMQNRNESQKILEILGFRNIRYERTLTSSVTTSWGLRREGCANPGLGPER